MNRLELGFILGLIFGILDVIAVYPQKRSDKTRAMIGAFTLRFITGILIGATTLPTFRWLQGLLIGLMVSLPTAIATRIYVPILATGIIGGAIIGFVIGQWGVS
ncbi:MAG: hypothetical protein H0W02_09490 [Ktedonobacteraceae bacterium]|nr:hypothetical protein [Ktedonobacteraceae bacterium]